MKKLGKKIFKYAIYLEIYELSTNKNVHVNAGIIKKSTTLFIVLIMEW